MPIALFDRKLDFASSPMNILGFFWFIWLLFDKSTAIHSHHFKYIRITSNLKLIKQENSGSVEQFTGAFYSWFFLQSNAL
jgi:hypothetical protein